MQAAHTPGFLIYMGGYAAMLAWFKLADVYHSYFAAKGLIVVSYNVFRVLFIFYLFWIVYAAGALALRRLGKFSELQIIERLVLGFFAGAGLWHVALLALGYLNLYTFPVAIVITVPAAIYAYPDVRDRPRRDFAAIFSRYGRPIGTIASWRAASPSPPALLLIIKGLYPGGGHDYYTHYFLLLSVGHQARGHLAERGLVPLLLFEGTRPVFSRHAAGRSPGPAACHVVLYGCGRGRRLSHRPATLRRHKLASGQRLSVHRILLCSRQTGGNLRSSTNSIPRWLSPSSG